MYVLCIPFERCAVQCFYGNYIGKQGWDGVSSGAYLTKVVKNWSHTWPVLRSQKGGPPPGQHKSEHASKFSGWHLQNGSHQFSAGIQHALAPAWRAPKRSAGGGAPRQVHITYNCFWGPCTGFRNPYLGFRSPYTSFRGPYMVFEVHIRGFDIPYLGFRARKWSPEVEDGAWPPLSWFLEVEEADLDVESSPNINENTNMLKRILYLRYIYQLYIYIYLLYLLYLHW